MYDLQIGIVGGLGHIGLIQAACSAKLGYKVTAYDNDDVKVEEILKGKLPFQEPGLEALLRETVNSGQLFFTSRIENLQDSELIYICVGTPSLPTGEADTSQVFSAVNAIARNRDKHCLNVVKSTVPVGTSRKITQYLQKNDLAQRVTMVSNPEFLREGAGLEDFWKPSRIIVGAPSEEIGKTVARIYRPPGVYVILTSWENAELIKYASNAFLAGKISFINEISQLCDMIDADIRVVSEGIGLDPRISPHFLEAGLGFSGPCLEKDLKSLIYQFEAMEKEAKLLKAVLQVNEEQRSHIVRKLQDQLGALQGRHIGILGMAFKAETDDMRDSHSLPIVKQLLSLGAKLTVHDPWIRGPHQAGISEADLPAVEWAPSPYEAAQQKEAVLILTAWSEYRELDLKRIKAALAYPLIIDGRNLFDQREMQELGINYLGMGI